MKKPPPAATGAELAAASGPHVLVAPDKFKGTLTAQEAAAAMRAGVVLARPDAVVSTIPVADGGEGTIEALLAAGATEHRVTVSGPLSRPTEARLAVHGTTAFVESAQACGLQLLEPDRSTALHAHSRGVGELVLAALDTGCERLVVGLGGSACTDGGAGMAQVLGASLTDATGAAVADGGRGLVHLSRVGLDGLDPRLRGVEVVVASDVRSPLVGPEGAAHVYGPQKGAGPEEVALLDGALVRFAGALYDATGQDLRTLPGSGAAGGLGAGLVAFTGATITSGTDLVLGLLGVDRALDGVDVVITGEGRLDDQSLTGKAPVGVAELAARHGVPTIAVAGLVEVAEPATLDRYFLRTWSLADHVGPDHALRDAAAAVTTTTAAATAAWLST